MLQLSMIDVFVDAWAFERDESAMVSALERYGRKLFYARMMLGQAMKLHKGSGSNKWFEEIQRCRDNIARLQRELYEFAPDRYPQFGALG